MSGGLSIQAWLLLWQECHSPSGMGGMVRTCWPDGGPVLRQPALTVEMFSLITAMVLEAQKNSG